MSWMYSDGDYARELKEQHKSVMRSIKEFEKHRKTILKQLWVPVWDKEGQVFIEPKKHAAWRRAVKWNARPLNTNGQYIQDALDVMRAIETNGYEAGIEKLNYVDVNLFGILDLVDKFYHHGHEFADKFVKSHPDWLTEYPKLEKYLDKQDETLTREEKIRSDEALKEAIEYSKQLIDSLNLTSSEKAHSGRIVEELEAIAAIRNVDLEAKKSSSVNR